jgi:hypothetical protein
VIWFEFHGILARWRNLFSRLFNVNGFNYPTQTKIHTAVPLVHEPSAFEVEMAIEKLKRHKSPGTDQIPENRLKQVVDLTLRYINLLFLFGIRRNRLSGRSRSVYLSISRVNKRVVVITEAYHVCQLL